MAAFIFIDAPNRNPQMPAAGLESPPPLSDKDTYTSWPGGVDPSARLYARGGRRSSTKRSSTRRRAARKTRRNRRVAYKTRRAGRR